MEYSICFQCLTLDFHREKWIYVHKGSTKEVRRFSYKIFLNILSLWPVPWTTGNDELTLNYHLASWILYAGRSLQPLGFLQRHQRHQAI